MGWIIPSSNLESTVQGQRITPWGWRIGGLDECWEGNHERRVRADLEGIFALWEMRSHE
jgi:hypothetical protein